MTRNLPRTIAPSQVEPGDTIIVEHVARRGIVTSYRGRVHERRDNGQVRNLVTKDGAVLLSWNGSENKGVTVILLRRSGVAQEPLFD